MRVTFDSFDEMKPLRELKASRHQRNKHPKKQIKRLAKIMREHGVRHAISISTLSGEVCFGHGRWQAALRNGWTEFPVVYQDFKDETEEYACVQSDNAIAHWAELDLSAINADIGALGPDFDLDLLGIEGFKLDAPFEAQADEDEVPEHVEPNARLGDIYKLGRHRLMCGDSLSVNMVQDLLDGQKADFIYMDPPYGMNLKTDYHRSNRVHGNTYRPVIGDDEPFDPRFFFELFADAREHFWWGADYYCQHLPKDGSWVVWDKKKEDLDESIGTGFELCWSKVAHKRIVARFLSSGFTAKERNENRVHPTQKPVALSEWFFERWGDSDDVVVELFGGSGSTLIACEKTKRTCYMMEFDPHYIDVIVARWEKYTGQKAELLERTDEVEPGETEEVD